MSDPNSVILYVENPVASAEFYAGLLGREPVECSANFAMFALASGVMLGLWSRHDAEPAAMFTGGGGELGFSLPDRAAVEALYAAWTERGLPIAQAPTAMDFGFTFVALDPDGHRLRAFTPE